KQILDPEIPPRDFQIDRDRREAVPGTARWVTNIFCENALETALQFREQAGGEVTALSLGPASAEESLRKALALKADQACLVELGAQAPRPNSLLTAKVLASAIRKLGTFDLVLLGREAGDWGAGQTGGLLAEELGLPFVGFVDHIEAAGEGVTLRRQTETGWERVQAALPLVATVTNSDENVPRIPKTRDIMMSHRKPLTTWNLSDLGIPADELAAASNAVEVVELFIPEKKSECEFIDGETLDDKLNKFAARVAAIVQRA
ncbi:MAG: electron transfer flavoprotein subunit beta/FixA family protein, partial [Planctomycetaceae bacterium]|nr:electron transfer flavoprotein subunit beta/FixA family protein [Planctomycetaceae bacterium]